MPLGEVQDVGVAAAEVVVAAVGAVSATHRHGHAGIVVREVTWTVIARTNQQLAVDMATVVVPAVGEDVVGEAAEVMVVVAAAAAVVVAAPKGHAGIAACKPTWTVIVQTNRRTATPASRWGTRSVIVQTNCRTALPARRKGIRSVIVQHLLHAACASTDCLQSTLLGVDNILHASTAFGGTCSPVSRCLHRIRKPASAWVVVARSREML